MAFPHSSAPLRAASGRTTRSGGHAGVTHDNTRHATRYTVIGNHLAQHAELSLLAIGLAVHIQSLPAGARIGIKCLAARFPESEHRIAGALRELERHGYLTRTRERLPSGRVVTRTVSCNQPGATPAPSAQSASVSRPGSALRPAPEPVPERPAPPSITLSKPDTPAPEGHSASEGHPAAVAVLVGLRRTEPRLTLSERDVHRLAPAATAWLERGVTVDVVHRTLTADLPDDVRHPAGLLAHRLNALLPPPLPAAPAEPERPDPLQNRDGCDRAFRAPRPGRCPRCRPDLKEAA
ncbi:helix-turn-helix domain-containing protein [Streptomyces violascens]|uniref:helix-turn-helix domain-containing protein n=1 Tax=Streptomyces violascens TaxID=67381 RepID=UPI003653D46B